MSKKSEARDRLRDLPDGELNEALDRARDELFRMKLGNYTNQLENPLVVRAKRREVARIMTMLHSRKQEAASSAGKGA
jgi:large subunit ribosomal protein L29